MPLDHSHDHYDGAAPLDHSHEHSHSGHNGHDHNGHDHSHDDDITPALQDLLYEAIDFSAVDCLNESEPHSGSKVLQKTWTERMDDEPELRSDADEQLLLHIPFTGQVALHSILIRTSTSPSAPSTLKIFANTSLLDFETAETMPPTQTLELAQSNSIQEYPIQRAKFTTTRSLTLFFEDNWGRGEEECTRISYLGFKGRFMRLNKEPIAFVYEAAANPRDHQAVAGIRDGLEGGYARGA